MRTEITLTGFEVNAETGAIEMNYLWDAYANSQVYTSEAQMLEMHSSLLHEPSEAVNWLMYYLVAMGGTAETFQTFVGKKLVIDVSPAVQQTIALVEAP